MDAAQLRALQVPLKEKYRDDPPTAQYTMAASGKLLPATIGCDVQTFAGPANVGLHAAAGGNGTQACSANMLLEALVGCAGVTLNAVALAMGIDVRGGLVVAEGDMDFRGTLGVDKQVPVGLTAVRLKVRVDSEASDAQLTQLGRLTERYCVIAQTLNCPVEVECRSARQTE